MVKYEHNMKGENIMDNFDVNLFLEYLKVFFQEVLEWIKTL